MPHRFLVNTDTSKADHSGLLYCPMKYKMTPLFVVTTVVTHDCSALGTFLRILGGNWFHTNRATQFSVDTLHGLQSFNVLVVSKFEDFPLFMEWTKFDIQRIFYHGRTLCCGHRNH